MRVQHTIAHACASVFFKAKKGYFTCFVRTCTRVVQMSVGAHVMLRRACDDLVAGSGVWFVRSFLGDGVRARVCGGSVVYGIKPVHCAATRASGALIPSGT